jgi:glucokinase
MLTNTVQSPYVLSADIGGSHITAAIVDMKQKKVLSETQMRVQVNSYGTAEQILQIWERTLTWVLRNAEVEINSLALAMPGPFDYENGISYIRGLDKYESLYGVNVKEYLAARLQIAPANIVFRNDAEAFLHGEVVGGLSQNYGHVIGFTLGTGMGSARSLSGQTKDLNWGSLSYGKSIADDYFSTRWFLKAYEEISTIKCANVKEMTERAGADKRISRVFYVFAENFAGFISNAIKKDRPDCIVLGGNIAKAHELFVPLLTDHLAANNTPCDIKIAQLDDRAALLGAAFTF